MLAQDRPVADVHQRERARAVGALRVPFAKAGLAEERGLLVAGDPRDGEPVGQEPDAPRAPNLLGASDDLRQDALGDAEERAQLGVPLRAREVHEQRARRVRDVGRVDRAARELAHEEAVDGPERELAPLGARARAAHVVEDPGDLRRAEVRVDDEPGLLAHTLDGPRVGFQRVANGRGAPALPDDGEVDGSPRRPVPDERRLALVGDPDGRDVGRRRSRRPSGHRVTLASTLAQISSASWETHPGCGKCCGNSVVARPRVFPDATSTTRAVEPVVPWSIARKCLAMQQASATTAVPVKWGTPAFQAERKAAEDAEGAELFLGPQTLRALRLSP